VAADEPKRTEVDEPSRDAPDRAAPERECSELSGAEPLSAELAAADSADARADVDDATGASEPDVSAELRERIARLPTEPGVYLFKDEADRVLYVGKAQNLRSRVRSYFGRGDGRIRMHFLLPRIRDVEVVATTNVQEALLLENQLIKQHKPRFNVRLRDDKNYLALRIDPREEFPRFSETRSFRKDGATYFGPYTSSISMRQTLRSLQRIFPLRTCSPNVYKSYARRGRPCLEHSVGRCAAPCCGKIEEPAYKALVDGAIKLLRGQSQDLLRDLEAQMQQAAADEAFERAAQLRDRIRAIEYTTERQSTVSTQFVDRDVFALARDARTVEIQALHVRSGKLLGGASHAFRGVRLANEEVLDSFLSQYYASDRGFPQEILIPFEVESGPDLEQHLSQRAERSVRIAVPRRGERRRLLELAQRNAELALAERHQRERSDDETLGELASLLHLSSVPRRIECYDTSHLRGQLHVGSRVSFVGTRPDSDRYRRYKLREAAPGDDYAALREILERRVARFEEDPAPDLLLLDGGKGQLSAIAALFHDLGIEDVALASIAKERDEDSRSGRVLRHGGTKRERIFLPGVKDPVSPAPDSPALLLLQRIRDESHRFAIRYHRELRRKMATRSILDELPGIGPVKRRALLRHLGSLERVRQAEPEELAAVPKLTRRDAEQIFAFFRAPLPADDPEMGPEADGDTEPTLGRG